MISVSKYWFKSECSFRNFVKISIFDTNVYFSSSAFYIFLLPGYHLTLYRYVKKKLFDRLLLAIIQIKIKERITLLKFLSLG